jgi:hypothetical protein
VKEHKFYLDADMKIEQGSKELWAAASTAINLPNGVEKQPDLLYFSAIFVSSGENLNNAYFLPSELVMAEKTIVNKALDVEHKEEDIIGHIYDRVFVDEKGKKLELAELASKDSISVDKDDMHVAIAGIIYKNRFPNVAKEVADGDWKVSMECYYTDYDVKVGSLVLTKQEAETLGLEISTDSTFGKLAQVIKNGKEIAKGAVTRVLRGIVFSGCGIVKQPANPPSVILETASEKGDNMKPDVVLNYDDVTPVNDSNNVTSPMIEANEITLDNKEKADGPGVDDNQGICVSYKRRVFAHEPAGPDTEVLHNDWCALYEESCTSFSRDTTDPECLRNIDMKRFARACAETRLKEKSSSDNRAKLLKKLQSAVKKAERLKK